MIVCEGEHIEINRAIPACEPVMTAGVLQRLGPLPESFFLDETPVVAKKLLGKGLVVVNGAALMAVEIVEVEAYLHDDPASHSFCGLTERNKAMFGPPGCCYVYLSYGVNYCLNVVTQAPGKGEAVLIRAAAPLLGAEHMIRNRGRAACKPRKNHLKSNCYSETTLSGLLNGPGKLTQALGLDLRYNQRCFNENDFKLVDLGRTFATKQIGRSTRIGISKAQDELLRFFVACSPWLSRRR